MSDNYEALTLDDELLLGEDDLTVERRRGDFTITSLDLKETRNGFGLQLVVSFENEEVIPFPMTDRFFVKYENPEKTDDENKRILNIGQGQLAKIRKFNGIEEKVPTALLGAMVSAEVWEDDDGFLRIGRYRKATNSLSY